MKIVSAHFPALTAAVCLALCACIGIALGQISQRIEPPTAHTAAAGAMFAAYAFALFLTHRSDPWVK